MDRNGYFQIKVDNGTFLKIIQPEGNGEPVSVGEVTDYLSLKGINYKLIDIDNQINSGVENYIKISAGSPLAERECMDLQISSDNMRAVARFYAPYEGEGCMSKDEIINDLKYKGVVFGIKEGAIDEFVKTREYCKDFVLAEGIPMKEGTDAYIEYLFNTDPDARPAQNEDGSVDYFNLDNICKCSKDQVLARIIPAVPGVDGKSLDGKFTIAPIPRNIKIAYGKNAHLSENKLELISDVNGHVALVDGRVFVSPVLSLSNVDTSTGNIDFDGSVDIDGTVKAGFSIKATGDVEVHGVVEGATIEAGGQIIIHRGINGMSRGILRSKSNIICKFIENATVEADGYVETDCVIHSTVTAGTHVTVQGKKGFVTGGIVRAGDFVEAKTLGSETGASTQIEVGVDPTLKKRYADLLKENETLKKDITRLEPVIRAVGERLGKGEKLSIDQLKQVKGLSTTLAQSKEKLKENSVELSKLEVKFDRDTNASVKVTGEVFPGTCIVVSDCRLVLKTVYHYCRFIKEGADVVMKPF